ncbi:unnamed protein product [Caenorhabditis angaria]|uniref:Uncharacterized protein n=1 Tax=Caenorhabditis angaria TaxID=860376 RepID=A0A9P1N7M1_9PELO|nr:unnamed protein product [Caenorhabditis angaria]
MIRRVVVFVICMVTMNVLIMYLLSIMYPKVEKIGCDFETANCDAKIEVPKLNPWIKAAFAITLAYAIHKNVLRQNPLEGFRADRNN